MATLNAWALSLGANVTFSIAHTNVDYERAVSFMYNDKEYVGIGRGDLGRLNAFTIIAATVLKKDETTDGALGRLHYQF